MMTEPDPPGIIEWEIEILHFDGRVPVRVDAHLETSVDGETWVTVHGSSTSTPFESDHVLLTCSGPVESGDWVRVNLETSGPGGLLVVHKRRRFTRKTGE